MGTDSRARLLAGVKDAIREDGLENLSLRDIARRANLSHAAPGKLFGDRRGMLTAFATEGYHVLTRYLAEAAASAQSGNERLKATGRAYVRFSQEHPEAFGLMFRMEHLDRTHPEFMAATQAAFLVLVEVVAQARGEGTWPAGDDLSLLVGAWALVHGMASLYGDGRLAGRIKVDLDEIAERLTNLFVDHLPSSVAASESGSEAAS